MPNTFVERWTVTGPANTLVPWGEDALYQDERGGWHWPLAGFDPMDDPPRGSGAVRVELDRGLLQFSTDMPNHSHKGVIRIAAAVQSLPLGTRLRQWQVGA